MSQQNPVVIQQQPDAQLQTRQELSQNISAQQFQRMVERMPEGQQINITQTLSLEKVVVPTEMDKAITTSLESGVKFFKGVIAVIIIVVIVVAVGG